MPFNHTMASENSTFTLQNTTLSLQNNTHSIMAPTQQVTQASLTVHQVGYYCNRTNHNSLVDGAEEKGQVDALLYIVVVLLFYAFAMVVLMVKYIRRENQEAELSFYFTEFVKRDQFQDSRFQNKQSVEAMKTVVAELYEPVTPECRVTAV